MATALVAAGCASPGEPRSPAEPVVVVAPAPSPATPPPGPEPAAEAPSPKAPDELVGTLSLTKGAQPVVAGVILPRRAFADRLGPDWQQVVVGRRVRVRGRRDDYRCGPMEQCLSSGVIPLLLDVVEIAICQTDDRAEGDAEGGTGKLPTVACPAEDSAAPSGDEISAPAARASPDARFPPRRRRNRPGG